ncbi:YfcC family protein [Brevibacillus daliensis]|uniref:YfcC family protein n=1 Tax=Brevibacillus daliensis TaxID=2892995 RepID=UPI0021035B52|nr:AbgT family transporter [Brevibacillus daliensis]
MIGLFEETLPYIAILVPLCIALGFDAITGAAIVLVGASVGFTSAIMNPFTVGVAQGIAELQPFSGLGFRIVVFIVMYVVSTAFVYRYAMKVKKTPSMGYYGLFEGQDTSNLVDANLVLKKRHKWILAAFVLNLIVIATGVIQYGWYITEIAGLFLLLGIVIGFLGRLSTQNIVDSFMSGASTVLYGALLIGVARGIVIILEQGHIMDTILYYLVMLIEGLPAMLTAVGMLGLQTFLSLFIPSGSGMAALTMPLMSPLADLVGITRQTAVLAFQFGDGISNLFVPGVAVAGIGIAGIPYGKWFRWLIPLLVLQYAIAIIFVIIAHAIGYM